MREFKLAERLLSLFTSPDNAAGIVGDLSEERGQRGSMWFWRQVLGTMLSLCRGVLFESPLVVVPLVIAGDMPLACRHDAGCASTEKRHGGMRSAGRRGSIVVDTGSVHFHLHFRQLHASPPILADPHSGNYVTPAAGRRVDPAPPEPEASAHCVADLSRSSNPPGQSFALGSHSRRVITGAVRMAAHAPTPRTP